MKVQRRERAGVVVSVRLTATEADALERYAEFYGWTLSHSVRLVLLKELRKPLVRLEQPGWASPLEVR